MLKKALYCCLSVILVNAKEEELEERYKDVSMGKCPHKPGTLKTLFDSENFDMH